MATSYKTLITYRLDAITIEFDIPFQYLARRFISVTLIGSSVEQNRKLAMGTDYRFVGKTRIQLSRPWGTNDGFQLIEIRRVTSATDRLIDFSDGSILRAYDLNTSQIQSLHVSEEGREQTADLAAGFAEQARLYSEEAKGSSEEAKGYLDDMKSIGAVGATSDALVAVQLLESGGVPRTQHSKNNDFVSVTDMGAIGDGVSLNDSAFTLAASVSGSAYVPRGRWRISNPMALPQTAKYYGEGTIVFDNAEWWRRGGSSGDINVREKYTLFYSFDNQSDVTLTFDGVAQPFTWIDSKTIEAAGTTQAVNVRINIKNGYLKLGGVPEMIRSYNILVNGGSGSRLNPQLPDPVTAPLGYDNTALGARALVDMESGVNNTAIGSKALMTNKSGINNTGVGYLSLYRSTGNANTAVGSVSGEWMTSGSYNAYFGASSGEKTKDGSYNVAVGFQALGEAFTTKWTVAVGYRANANTGDASQSNSVYVGAFAGDFAIGSNNTMVGYRAGNCLGAATAAGTGTGHDNVGVGMFAMRKNLAGKESVVVGVGAATESLKVERSVVVGFGASGTTAALGAYTVAIGYNAGLLLTGDNNVVVGQQAGAATTSGSGNVALGAGTLATNVTGSNNTSVGQNSGRLSTTGSPTTSFTNTTTIGNDARVAGSNQVQLGNADTTTYVYGTVQNRSDARDKSDVVDTELGIEFVNGLRPVSGKWNFREDYITTTEVIEEDGSISYSTEFDAEAHAAQTKKRTRSHQWFIAQEVAELLNKLGVEDFAGIQHHAVAGGDDVWSLGYDEFIPPVVKAIQDCWSRLDSLEGRLKKLEDSKGGTE